MQQIIKELYCHAHWIKKCINDELKVTLKHLGIKFQERHELYYIHIHINMIITKQIYLELTMQSIIKKRDKS